MKFLITAAGSGGHIYPALRLADELKQTEAGAEIIFLSSKKSIDKEIFKNTAHRVVGFDFVPAQRKTGTSNVKFCLKNLYFLLKFSKESIKVFLWILEIKPDLVIGFGGIGSVAAVISAKLLNIPTLIHEQNVVPGAANQLLGRFSSKIATGFEKSNKYFKNRNVVYTGNPIRSDLQRIDAATARIDLDLDKEKFTILVMGGSQGASFINKCFIKALKGLGDEKRRRLQIIHCCGKRDFTQVKKQYEDIETGIKVFEFCCQMSSAYSAADLIIGRAGAGTLNEICFFGKAAILIPYPYAQAHQTANAELLQEAYAATLVKQDDLACVHLTSLIEVAMGHPELLGSMAEKSKKFFCEASAANLARAAMSIVKNKKY